MSPHDLKVAATCGVRDGDVVAPLGGSQDLLLHECGSLTQQSLGSVGEHTQDDLIVDFLRDRHILIRADWVMVIRLGSTTSKLDPDSLLATFRNRHDLGVETDSDASALHVVLPLGVELALLWENDHGRHVARQRVVIDRVPYHPFNRFSI